MSIVKPYIWLGTAALPRRHCCSHLRQEKAVSWPLSIGARPPGRPPHSEALTAQLPGCLWRRGRCRETVARFRQAPAAGVGQLGAGFRGERPPRREIAAHGSPGSWLRVVSEHSRTAAFGQEQTFRQASFRELSTDPLMRDRRGTPGRTPCLCQPGSALPLPVFTVPAATTLVASIIRLKSPELDSSHPNTC